MKDIQEVLVDNPLPFYQGFHGYCSTLSGKVARKLMAKYEFWKNPTSYLLLGLVKLLEVAQRSS